MKNLSDFQRTLIMFIVSAITLVSIIFFWEFDAPEFLININKNVAIIIIVLALILTFGSIMLLMCSIMLFISIMCCEIANKRLEKKCISNVHVIKNSLSEEPSIVKLICERSLCKYCLNEQCENSNVKEDFKNIKTVTKVVLSVSGDSCKEYEEDESLRDPQS